MQCPSAVSAGRKSANIVFEDADVARTTMLSTMGIFGLSGQACAAGSRLLVHESLHDELVEGIAAFGQGLALGDPLDPSTMMGPLNNVRHCQRDL